MTYRQKYDQLHNWRKKIFIMTMYHRHMRLFHKGKWRVKDTANYFNVSMGLASENLNLFKHYNNLSKFVTRDSAIKFYR